MSDVFISYSRKDIAFARLIQESLQQSQIDTWIDWERIPVGEKWWNEICQAIENANVFMFIISKSSIGSTVCKDEINHALINNKRIIPIIVDQLQAEAIKEFAPELPQFNWIIFERDQLFRIEENPELKADKPEDGQVALPQLPQFEEALGKLNKAIHTDWEWVKYHTRLQVNALLWENNARNPGYLIRGAALEDSEQQLLRASSKEPRPTELQIAFVTTSRKEETFREKEKLQLELKARRRQQVVIWAVGIGLVVAIALGIVARNQRNVAVDQRNLAVSRQLAAQGLVEAGKNFDLGLLLGLEADRRTLGADWAVSNLLEILQKSPQLDSLLRGHQDDIMSIAFSPNGQLLASGSFDKTIILWDNSNPDKRKRISQPLIGHTAGVNTLAFSSDGKTLASGSGDGSIILWDVSNTVQPKQIGQPLTGNAGAVTWVTFSPDGKLLASANTDKTIILWDTSNPNSAIQIGKPFTNHNDVVISLAFSPEGKILASGSYDASIILWDVNNPGDPIQVGQPLNGHTSKVRGIAFSPDGETLASASHDKTIILWDVRNPEAAKPIGKPLYGHSGEIICVAFSPDGKLLASGGVDKIINVWNISNLNNVIPILGLVGHSNVVYSLAFNPAGQGLASGSWDRTIIIWNVDRMRSPNTFSTTLTSENDAIYGLDFHPNKPVLATSGLTVDSGSIKGAITLWDVSESESPKRIGNPLIFNTETVFPVVSVDFSPDGNIMASGHYKTIILWDVSDPIAPKQLGQPLSGHTDGVNVAFSPIGKVLASGSWDGSIILWNISTPEIPEQLSQQSTANQESIMALEFSQDGQTLLSVDKTEVILWDVDSLENPQKISTIPNRSDNPLGVAFHPKKKLLALGNNDNNIIFLDFSNPQETRQIGQPLIGHTDIVTGIAFSSDGQKMVTGSRNGLFILWNVSNPEFPYQLSPPIDIFGKFIYNPAFSPDGNTIALSNYPYSVYLFDTREAIWRARACKLANRNFTQAEWEIYMPVGDDYQKTCSEQP